MTDNFDVMQLGVEPDEAGFDALDSHLQGTQNNIISVAQALAMLQAPADQVAGSFDKVSTSIETATSRLKAFRDTQQQIATEGAGEQPSADQMLSTGEGGGVGSLFGVAHGIRAASGLGRMAGLGAGGTGALTGVADLIYLEEGMRKLSNIMPTLSEGIGSVIDNAGGAAVVLPELGVALAAVGVAVAVVTSVTAEYNRELKTGEEMLKGALTAQEQYYVDIHTLTDTQAKAEIEKKKSDLAAQQDIMAEDARVVRGLISSGQAGNAIANDPRQPLMLTESDKDLMNEPLVKAADQTKQLAEAYNKASGSADGLDQTITRLAQGLQQGKFAIDDTPFLQSLKDMSAQRKQEEADLKLTAQANRDKQAALQDEYAQTADNIAALQRHGITTKEDQAALDAYMQKLHDLNLEIGNLAENLTKVENTEIAKATAKELQAEADATAKAEADKLRILQDGIQKDLDIRQAEADKVAELASKLADDEARVQRDTYRQFQDDWSNYAFNLNKLQVDAQRTETTDLQDHLQKVADINATAKADEFQAILDRNFLQIAKDEAKKTTDLSREDEHYQTQEQKLQQHLRNQEEDLARSLQHQMDQQRVAEQRKLDDLQTAEVRQIEVAQDAEIRSLNAERVHVINLYNVRVQAYIAEEVLLRNHLQNEVNIILGLALQAQQSAASGGSSVPAQSYSDSFYREIFQ